MKGAGGGVDVFAELRSNGVARVARALGLQSDGTHVWPCPACNVEHRGSEDARPPVNVVKDGGGWICQRCKATGDAITLAALVVSGHKLEKGDPRWKQVLARATEAGLTAPPPAGEVRKPLPTAAPKGPPGQQLVQKLWDGCRPANELADVAAWLEARGLDVGELAARDLVRGLPGQLVMPDWARFGGESWLHAKQQFRVIVPLYNAQGGLGTLHARALKPQNAKGKDKAANPAKCSGRLHVMANPLARLMLGGEAAAVAATVARGILVVEGVPDFLTASTVWPVGETPAVVGVISGSWPKDGAALAARIPTGARVTLATHADKDGQKYANDIAGTLRGRAVEVVRLRPVNGKGDLNDHHRAGGVIDLGQVDVVQAEAGIPSEAPSEALESPSEGLQLEDLGPSSTIEEVREALRAWVAEIGSGDPLERATARDSAVAVVKNVHAVEAPAALVDAALLSWDQVQAKSEQARLEKVQAERRAVVPVRTDGLARPTDTYNAERFVREHGSELRFCTPQGKWYAWRKNRWVVDVVAEAPRRLKATIEQMRIDFAAAGNEDMTTWAFKSENESQRRAALKLASFERDVQVLPEQFDRDPWVLNLRNGTLDLRTATLRPHRREDHLTKVAPVDFDPNATAFTWAAFLQRIFAGDHELIAYVQRLCGYMLTGEVREHVLVLFHGGGANGKSTLTGTLQNLLGVYARAGAPNLLMASPHERHPTELADLHGARLVVCQESDQNARLDEAKAKALTGGDRVKARRMGEDFWEFEPSHKLVLSTNHRPRIRGNDDGIWRRMHLVPFEVQIPEAERDPQLVAKLRGELPGILLWALEGCRQWQAQGLQPPAKVLEATRAYRETEDVIGGFLADCCNTGEFHQAESTLLYNTYKKWSEQNGERATSQKNFSILLRDRGFSQTRVHGGRKAFRGISVAAGEAVNAGEGSSGSPA